MWLAGLPKLFYKNVFEWNCQEYNRISDENEKNGTSCKEFKHLVSRFQKGVLGEALGPDHGKKLIILP